MEAFSAIFNYIDGWYNTLRKHSALDGMSPLNAFIKNQIILEQLNLSYRPLWRGSPMS